MPIMDGFEACQRINEYLFQEDLSIFSLNNDSQYKSSQKDSSSRELLSN